MDYNALSLIEGNDITSVSNTLKKIAQFQAVVQSTLKKDHDFGIIPGTPKPTLYKAGAEKVNMLMQVSPEYNFLDRTMDFEKGFFNYEIQCTLFRNIVQDGVLIKLPVAQGVGSCNNMEKKFRWTNVKEEDIPMELDKSTLKKSTNKWGKTTYQIPNPDPYTLANTILKMAKKRAYVDATLQIAALSEVFTQDLEDIKDILANEYVDNAEVVNDDTPKGVTDIGSFIITFGNKHKGKSLNQIYDGGDVGYLQWLMDKSNDVETKSVVGKFLTSKGKPSDVNYLKPTPQPTPIQKARDITPEEEAELPFTL